MRRCVWEAAARESQQTPTSKTQLKNVTWTKASEGLLFSRVHKSHVESGDTASWNKKQSGTHLWAPLGCRTAQAGTQRHDGNRSGRMLQRLQASPLGIHSSIHPVNTSSPLFSVRVYHPALSGRGPAAAAVEAGPQAGHVTSSLVLLENGFGLRTVFQGSRLRHFYSVVSRSGQTLRFDLEDQSRLMT